MSKVLVTESYLTDIADAIREKLGSQETFKPSEMADAIGEIPGGGGDVSIEVTTMPTVVTYDEGDALDLTGIVVTATYPDETTEVVTSSCTFNPADGSTLSDVGTVPISVDYKGLETSFNVTVESTHTETLEVSTMPTKTVYDEDEQLDLTGIVVNHVVDGVATDVTDDCTFSPAEGTVLWPSTSSINILL